MTSRLTRAGRPSGAGDADGFLPEAPGPPLAASEEALSRLLREVPFTRQYGFAVHAVADGVCTLDVPFQETFTRPGGILSGQVFMAAADVAMWLAIMTRFGLEERAVTSAMTTSFLSSAHEEPFRCTATVLRWGRRQIYGVAECTDGAGKLLTHHVITYVRPS